MRNLIAASAIATATVMAVPVAAQSTAPSGAYASAALQRGDMVSAEMSLEAQRQANPDMPEVLLNLATVYARTNRDDRAADMYRRVLAQDNVSMKLANGRAMDSHALARIGLASLNAAELTTASR